MIERDGRRCFLWRQPGSLRNCFLYNAWTVPLFTDLVMNASASIVTHRAQRDGFAVCRLE